MSRIDEIRKRHEAISVDMRNIRDYDPSTIHADRAYLLEHIAELEALLVRWELSYTDGMASDDLRELYLTTLEKLDE